MERPTGFKSLKVWPVKKRKSRRMRYTGHSVNVRKTRNKYRITGGDNFNMNLQGKKGVRMLNDLKLYRISTVPENTIIRP
jgi:hypothetical protein